MDDDQFEWVSNPGTRQRLLDSFNNWMSWRDNRVFLTNTKPHLVHDLLKSLGYQRDQDYILKNPLEIRFKSANDMAICLIGGLADNEVKRNV